MLVHPDFCDIRPPPVMKGPGSDVVAKKVDETEIVDGQQLLENTRTGLRN